MEDLELETTEKKSDQRNLRAETRNFDDYSSANVARKSLVETKSFSKVKIIRRGKKATSKGECFEVACYTPLKQKEAPKKKKGRKSE